MYGKKAYIGAYYAEISEIYKDKNGNDSYYYRLMSDTTVHLEEKLFIKNKNELKEVVLRRLETLHWRIREFDCIENENGWSLKRKVKLDENNNELIMSSDDDYTHTEEYSVVIIKTYCQTGLAAIFK